MKGTNAVSGSTARRWTRETARRVLEARERSGLSVNRFAARHGLSVERLYRWQQRLGKKTMAPSAPPRFAEVRLAVPAPTAAIEVALPGGFSVRFSGPSRLDDVMAVLGRLETR